METERHDFRRLLSSMLEFHRILLVVLTMAVGVVVVDIVTPSGYVPSGASAGAGSHTPGQLSATGRSAGPGTPAASSVRSGGTP